MPIERESQHGAAVEPGARGWRPIGPPLSLRLLMPPPPLKSTLTLTKAAQDKLRAAASAPPRYSLAYILYPIRIIAAQVGESQMVF